MQEKDSKQAKKISDSLNCLCVLFNSINFARLSLKMKNDLSLLRHNSYYYPLYFCASNGVITHAVDFFQRYYE